MIHNVYYKMVEEYLIYFGNIYFPVRQIKPFFFFHLRGLASSDLENSFTSSTSSWTVAGRKACLCTECLCLSVVL